MTSYVVTVAVVAFLFINVVNTQDDGERPPENGGRRPGRGPWKSCCRKADDAVEEGTGNYKDAYMDCFIKRKERCGISREEIEDVLSKSEELTSGTCPKFEDICPIIKKCHEKRQEVMGEKINQCCQDASGKEEKWNEFQACMFKNKNKREEENPPHEMKRCRKPGRGKPFEEVKSFVTEGKCEEAVNAFKNRSRQREICRKPEEGPSSPEESTE
ncbi:uncharacterized protein [Centruroides vittatus]|uniref:uncharacterized protein n=1 Tax=Centruroides vittatus TaxID=120091 RepID=UPI0035105451